MSRIANEANRQAEELRDFVLQKNIDLLRSRLKGEDDVDARLRLWQLVREMEVAQQTAYSNASGQDG